MQGCGKQRLVFGTCICNPALENRPTQHALKGEQYRYFLLLET